MGGENSPEEVSLAAHLGSSPHGRGKRPAHLLRLHQVGLIPARAGKTHHDQDQTVRLPAHPRAGGENPARRHGRSNDGGSSPRGRGKPPAPGHYQHAGGLIPARAGKTRSPNRPRRRGGAHPRAGGENMPASSASWAVVGSSPRGRGKRRTRRGQPIEARLIPARAGKTLPSMHVRQVSRAHPRAGGENIRQIIYRIVGVGSSPRGRGKPERTGVE